MDNLDGGIDIQTIVVDLKQLFPNGKIKANFLRRYYYIQSIIYINGDHIHTAFSNWMKNCKSLRSVDMKCLVNLKTVGHYWMYGCYSLETIEMKNLKNLTNVGNYWLS